MFCDSAILAAASEGSGPLWTTLYYMLLLLGFAFLIGTIAERLKQSAIVGYLIAGTLLGPAVLNLIEKDSIQLIAELGVSLLLFSIGLEFSFRRLRTIGGIAFIGGSLQTIGTLVVFAGISMIWFPLYQSLVIGAMVALSSTACVLRMLKDKAEMESTRGRNALGILLMQDIMVVPLVLMVTMLGVGGGSVGEVMQEIGMTVASAVGLIVVFYLLFYIIVPKVLLVKSLAHNRELVILLAIVIAIGSSWGAYRLGLSPALGAFIAGMLLAESEYASQIRADIGSLRTLFVTLFFSSIGMLANPEWMLINWWQVGLLALAVFVGKAFIILPILMMFKNSKRQALASGFTLAQIGEFSFVFATIAWYDKVEYDHIFNLMVSVTIATLFLTPYMVNYAPQLAKLCMPVSPGDTPVEEEYDAELACETSIFIVGFGPAGQRIAEALISKGFQPRIIEQNPNTAKIAQSYNLKTYVGSASQAEFLEHAGVMNARVVVLTIPDPKGCHDVINLMKQMNSEATIIARARYHVFRWELEMAGADHVIDEEEQVGLRIAAQVHRVIRKQKKEEAENA